MDDKAANYADTACAAGRHVSRMVGFDGEPDCMTLLLKEVVRPFNDGFQHFTRGGDPRIPRQRSGRITRAQKVFELHFYQRRKQRGVSNNTGFQFLVPFAAVLFRRTLMRIPSGSNSIAAIASTL